MKRKSSSKLEQTATHVKLDPDAQTSEAYTAASVSAYTVVIAQILCDKYGVDSTAFAQRYCDAEPQTATFSRITLALVLSRICRVIVELCRENDRYGAIHVRQKLMPLIISHDDIKALCPSIWQYNSAYQHVLSMTLLEHITCGGISAGRELARPYPKSICTALSHFSHTKTRIQGQQNHACAMTLKQYTSMSRDIETEHDSSTTLYNVMSPSQYLFELIVTVDTLGKRIMKKGKTRSSAYAGVVSSVADNAYHDDMIPLVSGSTRKGRAPTRKTTKMMRLTIQTENDTNESKVKTMRCGALKHLLSVGTRNQNLYHQQWCDGVCLQNPYFYDRFMEHARMSQTHPVEVPVYHCDHNEKQEQVRRPNVPVCAAGKDCYYLKFTAESPDAHPLHIMLTPDEQIYYEQHKSLPKETYDSSDERYCIDCICSHQFTLSKQYDEMIQRGEAVHSSPFFAMSRFCVEVGGLRGFKYKDEYTYVSRCWGGVSMLYPLNVRRRFASDPMPMDENERQQELKQNFTHGVYVPSVTMSHFLLKGASAGRAMKH